MNWITRLSVFLSISILLASCEVSCNIGDKGDEPESTTKAKEGSRIYNDIQLKTEGVKVEKAYLVYQNGDAVAQSNIVDFTQPVNLVLVIEHGWKEDSNRVKLGVSEIISTEKGQVLLNEEDLFAQYPEGVSAADAKRLTITAKIILKQKVAPLTTFHVGFRVWDKNGPNFIEGSYKLYAK